MNQDRYTARDWTIAFGIWSGLAVMSILQIALILQQRGQPIQWAPLATMCRERRDDCDDSVSGGDYSDGARAGIIIERRSPQWRCRGLDHN